MLRRRDGSPIIRPLLTAMNSTELFLNPQTGLLRSGWRAAVFFTLIYAPYFIVGLFLKPVEETQPAVFDVSLEMILTYVVLVAWVIAVSWLCLRFLERMKLSALGFAFHSGWFSDILKGGVTGSLMIVSVVILQIIGGGTRVRFNPVWYGDNGIDWAGARVIASETLAALALFILAAAFEELVYRGYAFQTMLRGAPAVVPIILFSIYFGLSHLDNPNSAVFSTTNTVLAGIWLSVAYLRTRNLWFPTALHAAWNWVMGAFFGIPVSGLRIPQNSILVSTTGEPVWLTGGSYGSEGGVAATFALVIATIVIWRARFLRVSPEMHAAFLQQASLDDTAISLGLKSGDEGRQD